MINSIEKVSIIGLGALGILYAEHISTKIPFENLRIIADQNRIDRYKSQGIYCNDKKCAFNYVTPDLEVEPADLLIIAVKYTHLKEAITAVEGHIGSQTIILSVLNGIESENDIALKYGQEHMLYCVAQGMTAHKNGNQMNYNNKGIICFGELKAEGNSKKVNRVKAFFDFIEMPYEINNQMEIKLWSKLMINVGINQTIAYYKSNNGAVQKQGEQRDMMIAAMEEVLDVATQKGIGLTRESIKYWLNIIDTLHPEGMPSMAQDIKAKRLSEIELFAGTITRLGHELGIDVPVNELFYQHFKELEKTY